jgi:hypothetical protein
MGFSHRQIHYLELFFTAAIFVVADAIVAQISYVSSSLLVLNLLITLLFIVFAVVYVLGYGSGTKKGIGRAGNASLHIIFLIIIGLFFSIFLFSPIPRATMGLLFVNYFISSSILFVAFVPPFFLTYIGVYFLRKGDRRALLLLIAVFLMLLLYYTSSFLVKSYTIDDEELLAMQSVAALLHGMNPYTLSFVPVLIQNASIGLSITTSNMVVGVMDYPALFFLAAAPFYFLSQPTVANLGAVDFTAQAAVFIFIMLMALAFALDRKELLRVRLTVLAFFMIALINIASTATFLMIALLLLSYAKLGSRYAWIPLGLCLAMQEELWLPVLFLLIYSFNNEGFRNAARKTVGSIAVFLAINGVFIIGAPAKFFSDVFAPLGPLLPGGSSAIGFAIARYFPISLPSYTLLFELTAVFLGLVLLYWNEKKLIPIFSMVPFIVLQHSINAYYATFLFLFVVALGLRDGPKLGIVERKLKDNKKAVYAATAAFFLLFAMILYASHMSFVRNFDVSSGTASLAIFAGNASSTYTVALHYSNMSNNTVYVAAMGLDAKLGGGFFGFINDSIIGERAQCNGSYNCLVNVNRIALQGSAGTYNLSVRIRWLNSTRPIEYVSALVYNGNYLYITTPAANVTS